MATGDSLFPSGEQSGRLIVCEKTGRWAAALGRELAGTAIRVFQTRSVSECADELAAHPASFAALELAPENLLQILTAVATFRRRFPAVREVVLAARGMEAHQWLVREAGAAGVVFSTRQLAPIARMARRHLASQMQAERNPIEHVMAARSAARTDKTENCK